MTEDALASKAVEELVASALQIGDLDDHSYWAIVNELQRRGDRGGFEAMNELCRRSSPQHRQLGLHVLGQLGYPQGRPFLEQALPVVVDLCLTNSDVGVVHAAVSALGHLGDQRGLEALIAHAGHPDEEIRFGVAVAIPSVAGDPPAERAVETLLLLMEDPVSDVRDWATFGLGVQLAADSPAIRDALAARLHDADGDTAAEAVLGLARRNDSRAVEVVGELLGDPDVGDLVVEAAGELARPRFLSALRRLKEDAWDRGHIRGHCLDGAIAACERAATQ